MKNQQISLKNEDFNGIKPSHPQFNIQMGNKASNSKGLLIPSNAKTIIILLGQCLLPTGQPHQWMHERVNFTYSILEKKHQDIKNTYIIASGSDVSNIEFAITDKKKKHISEAQMMHRLFMKLYQGNPLAKQDNSFNFPEHIIKEDKAKTTIQNFYQSFLMIDRSNLNNLQEIIIVTSDFHMKRAKLCFDTLFFKGKDQLLGNIKYEKVQFLQSPSQWTSQYFRDQKFEKQNKLFTNKWLVDQMKKTAKIVWDQIKGSNYAMFYHDGK